MSGVEDEGGGIGVQYVEKALLFQMKAYGFNGSMPAAGGIR